jgi:flagellar FliJ protein
MKKFVFSLEKVLNFKQQTLNIKLNEMALFQQKLKEVEQEIDRLNNEFSGINQKMVEELQTGLNLNDLLVYKTYFQTLDQKIQKYMEDKRQLLEVIAQKKADIVVVNSEISGLEKLRDKQLGEYMKNKQKMDELEMDEYVNQVRGSAS